MKFAGSELLSRSTIVSGRSLMIVCGTTILVEYLSVDISGLTIAGINPEEAQIRNGSFWVVVFLWLSLTINWVSDFVALGLYNRAETEKVSPSTYGGSSRLVNMLSHDTKRIEVALENLALEGKFDAQSIIAFNRNFIEISKSLERHRVMLYIYFYGYAFIVPTISFFVASVALFS